MSFMLVRSVSLPFLVGNDCLEEARLCLFAVLFAITGRAVSSGDGLTSGTGVYTNQEPAPGMKSDQLSIGASEAQTKCCFS
jgi:hypothetical protein